MVSWLADKSSRTMLQSMTKASSRTSAPASLICTKSQPRSHCAEQCDSAMGCEVTVHAESEHLGRSSSLTRSTQQTHSHITICRDLSKKKLDAESDQQAGPPFVHARAHSSSMTRTTATALMADNAHSMHRGHHWLACIHALLHNHTKIWVSPHCALTLFSARCSICRPPQRACTRPLISRFLALNCCRLRWGAKLRSGYSLNPSCHS